jgi:phenylalanyl-tRNA synthetase alpha chain
MFGLRFKHLKSLLHLTHLYRMVSDINKLHPIEISLLRALVNNRNGMSIMKLANTTVMSVDQIRRGIEWLKFKNLISLNERSAVIIALGANGQKALREGLPERKLVEAIKKGKKTLEEISELNLLKRDELNAAIAAAKRNKWIEFMHQNNNKGKKNLISLTTSADTLSIEEKLFQRLDKQNNIHLSELDLEERKAFDILKRRPDYLIEKQEKDFKVILSEEGKKLLETLSKDDKSHNEMRLTAEMITSGKWRDVKLSPLDVEATVPSLHVGKKHPLTDVIDEIKEIFVGLGFSEINGSVVQPSFWNFDALFTPQDHPAREMHDTFYISGMKKSKFASVEQIEMISKIHKNEWGYQLDIEESGRLVLRTHTTPVTIKYLADKKPENARVFSIGRVFRNEKISYKHLVEFYQLEGIVTGPDVTLQDLMGLQKEFYKKLGIMKIKFWPTFFPYTEPSLQCMIYNDMLGRWVELGGMGIFRPEVTEPLGIKNPVLAWGCGLERIAMLRFNLEDARELYDNSINWLRSVPKCL